MKSAEEAQRVLPKHATPSKLSKETAEELDCIASPGKIVEARDSSSSSCNSNSLSVFRTVNGGRDNSEGHKYARDHIGTPNKDRLPVGGSVSPSRYTPTRDRNGAANCQGYRNGHRDRY